MKKIEKKEETMTLKRFALKLLSALADLEDAGYDTKNQKTLISREVFDSLFVIQEDVKPKVKPKGKTINSHTW